MYFRICNSDHLAVEKVEVGWKYGYIGFGMGGIDCEKAEVGWKYGYIGFGMGGHRL